jgi:hypothetical protein
MDDPVFIKTDLLPSVTGMSVAQSLYYLSKDGLQPIDLGRGRGKGLRWHVASVRKVFDTLNDNAQQCQPKAHKPARVHRPVSGRTLDDLYKAVRGAK